MPNRILREGILSSRRVDRLSEKAELFYRRLMSKLDDFGRYESDVGLLLSNCYPLRVKRLKEEHVRGWLMECQQACLLVTYGDGQKAHLQYLDWKQQQRTDSKFPAPPEQLIADAEQGIANEHLVVFGDVGVVVSEGVIGGAASRSRPEQTKDETPVVITLPLIDGSDFEVRQSLVDDLEPLCPRVHVPDTLKEMKLWLIGKPGRKKTRRGIKSFITTWLGKEQEKLAHGR